MNSHHNLLISNNDLIKKNTIISSEDPAKIFQFSPIERDKRDKNISFQNDSRISVLSHYAINILDNTKVVIKKFSLKKEGIAFLLQDVITQNSIKHSNIIELYSIFHRESYAQIWLVEEDFGHSFFDTIRGICPKSHKWEQKRCSDCIKVGNEKFTDDSETDSVEEISFSSGIRFPEVSISVIVEQILLALQVLHSNEKVHRNLHSKSIFIDKNNFVKIDRFFHQANEMDESDRQMIISQHPLPSYIAPELLKPNCLYTPKIDVFSIGIFILELLEGATPLCELDRTEIFSTISKMELVLPEIISPLLKNFLSITLNRSPSKRASVSQLLEHPFIKQNKKKN